MHSFINDDKLKCRSFSKNITQKQLGSVEQSTYAFLMNYAHIDVEQIIVFEIDNKMRQKAPLPAPKHSIVTCKSLLSLFSISVKIILMTMTKCQRTNTEKVNKKKKLNLKQSFLCVKSTIRLSFCFC